MDQMRRIILILSVLLVFIDTPQIWASQAIGTYRFSLRWNGYNRGLPLPFSGWSNPRGNTCQISRHRPRKDSPRGCSEGYRLHGDRFGA